MTKTARTFPTGGIVDRDDLVDREAVLLELFTRTFEHGNSVVVSGPRQIGKSSLAHELKRRVSKAGGWGIYIDLSRVVGDERELAHFVARATYDQARGVTGAFARLREFISGAPRPVSYQSDLDLALTFHSGKEQSTTVLLEQAFGLADTLAASKDARAVVVLDEFQELRKISRQAIAKVRSSLQEHMGNAAYVFMGSEVGMMDALFRDPKMRPFRLATPVSPGIPSGDAWRAYIARRFAANKVVVRPDEIDDLVAFTGGHPRDLMEACEHLLTIRSLNPTAPGAVELAKAKALNSLEVGFDELWRRLEQPLGTQATALRIANGQQVYGRGRPRKTVTRTVDALQSAGIIRRTGRGSYEFLEPLFGVYLGNSRASE